MTILDSILSEYRSEVLRWNRQINLVGRSDPDAILDQLIEHCSAALGALMAPTGELAALAPNLLYCDIGSGAGLPGVVWHALLSESGYRPRSVLSEPRRKRAWFLARTARQLAQADLHVSDARWGAAPIPVGRWDQAWQPRDILLSLKALRMSDEEVLGGLEGALTTAPTADNQHHNQQRATVVRFLPPGPSSDTDTLDGQRPPDGSIRAAEVVGRWRRASRRIQTFVTPTVDSSLLVSVFYTSD